MNFSISHIAILVLVLFLLHGVRNQILGSQTLIPARQLPEDELFLKSYKAIEAYTQENFNGTLCEVVTVKYRIVAGAIYETNCTSTVGGLCFQILMVPWENKTQILSVENWNMTQQRSSCDGAIKKVTKYGVESTVVSMYKDPSSAQR